ncbi:MAG: VWA domain-containing protein [Sandaracinaceae bacterium]|nr:VWA domain-containing protein [Sandaracinaceae bacterium]
MGWDEKIFGWLYGKARALARPRVPEEVLARQATLEACRDRLRVLACALAEASVEVREAENEGGFAGTTLLLPSSMRHAPTVQENEEAYLLRVTWTVTAMRMGMALACDDPLERALATHLSAPAIREATLAGSRARRSAGARTRRWSPRPSRDRRAARRPRWPRSRACTSASRPSSRRSRRRSAPGWRERPDAPRRARARCARPSRPSSQACERWAGARPPRCPRSGAGSARPPSRQPRSEARRTRPTRSPTGTELEGKPREHVRRVELAQEGLEDNPLVHSFEKVHTAEEHRGGSRSADGEDELADHAEALRELDLREVVRTSERTSSLLRCDVMIEGAAGDLIDGAPPGGGIPYDEWNERARAYRPGWCTVRPGFVAPRVSAAEAGAFVAQLRASARAHADAVRAELLRLELARRWRSRCLDGPEIDDDAVVDRYAALASGHTGTDGLYRARPRSAAELAVLLLVDASLSTDGWVQDRRVLDVELEAALVLADALDGLGVELGIATFSSHTRRDCRFDVIKGMEEPWPAAEHRLASVAPSGYTRIGPALRHAAAALERTRARRRLLLLITDAKPNDYDRYEGSYGIADVRQAVREAERGLVHVHALAMDPRARLHLPRMFGPSCHTAVSGPDRLADAVGRICASMRA